MTAWSVLTKTALLGTGRQGDLPFDDPLVGELFTGHQGAKEEQLLAMAATVALWQNAGRQPTPCGDAMVFDPAPTDELAEAPASAGRIVPRLGNDRDLLKHWLEQCRKHNWRVPAELLPRLLEAGRLSVELRPALCAVIGRRGTWLAKQNAKWRYATVADAITADAPNDEDWLEGTPEVRRVYLERLRELDACRARDLLANEFAKEKARLRAQFVATFAVGLSLEDEPFLESCLDDRSMEVRRQAAALLRRLSASQFGQRMQRRAEQYLQITSKTAMLTRKVKLQLTVNLPSEELDEAAIRDGLTLDAPKGTGKRAWLLTQILRCVPPDHWLADSAEPLALLTAADASDFAAELLGVWTDAAVAFQAASWAAPLISIYAKRAKACPPTELWQLIPAGQREEAVLAFPQGKDDDRALIGLLAVDDAWSPAFSREIIKRLARAMKSNRGYGHGTLHQAIVACGMHVPVDLTTELFQAWDVVADSGYGWRNAVDRALEHLRLRQDMERTFNQQTLTGA